MHFCGRAGGRAGGALSLITSLHLTTHSLMLPPSPPPLLADGTYNVKYLLGGSEKNVERYVSPL